ncbi:MAG: hypothetical protein IKS55_04660 [Oscillospiraceae bacterium]|nr:hypothetical protein [Oscillospiraceae bacterium]
MKKRTLILAVLAVLLVLCSSIGSAIAYFTTFASARGGYVIQLGGKTEITERIVENRKIISIKNTPEKPEDAGKYPVFVRVKAFTDSDGVLDDSSNALYPGNSDALWERDGENCWRYRKALYAGEETEPAFTIDVSSNRRLKPEETMILDVVVVYESVPAVFTDDGSPDLDTAWETGDITIHRA